MLADELARRRAQERVRQRRQRRVAAVAALVFVGGVAAAIAYAATGRPSEPDPQQTPEASVPARMTVAGSKPNEAATTTARSATTTTAVAPATRSPLAALRGKTIAVDPGHNGGNYLHTTEINRLVNAGTLRKACDTTGTETNGGYTEAAYTLDVSLRLAKILRAAGAHVVLTRTTNTGWGPCITERAAIGNRAHAAVAISIHADGGPATGRGFHVIYPPTERNLVTATLADNDGRLAVDVRDAYLAVGMPESTYLGRNGLDERSDLGGLNLSRVPKVFIETGNMRNATDARLLESPAFRQKAAGALARGLAAYLAGAK